MNPIHAAGIDLGGTKSEVQLFDAQWQCIDKRRDPTPATYGDLVSLLATQVQWALAQAGQAIPVGLGAAGLLYPDGTSFTANLPVKGQPLLADIAAAAGHSVTYVNDCRAMTLSEAIYGAGREHRTVMGLILGTGVGGGIVHDGKLYDGPAGTGGEFGHMPASAEVMMGHNLPIKRCGCGRWGCTETYIAGPGIRDLAEHLMGERLSPEAMAARKDEDPEVAALWSLWLALTADMLLTLVQVADPDVIVLGGGLSQIDGLCDALTHALAKTQIEGFGAPLITLAQGGDASGARGAAMAAVGGQAHA